MKKKSKKSKNLTRFVVLSFVLIILFTAACFVFAWFDKEIKDPLIYSFYSTFAIELHTLAGIKKSKKSSDESEVPLE